MTALVVLPGVLLYGTALNQTLVSTVIGALNASVVFRLMRGLTDKLSLQVGLTILALPFFVIMFSDQWLRWDTSRPLLQRLNWRPLFALGGRLAVFLGISFVYNYLRFDTPLPASYHYWMEYHKEGVPEGVLVKGLFDATYIPRHIPTAFEMLPVFQSQPPHVL